MKRTLSHLPINKKQQIKEVVELIEQFVPETQIVILFGSYAKGDYVDYDQRIDFGVPTSYSSDYDFCVLTPKNGKSLKSVRDRLLKARLKYNEKYPYGSSTRVSFLAETFEEFNQQIHDGRYFYTEIKNDGIILYNPQNLKLNESRELNEVEYLSLSIEYFEEKYSAADDFMISGKFLYEKERYKRAAFQLHQATENLLNSIILSISLKSPKSHELIDMMDNTKLFTFRAIEIFPEYDIKTDRLFTILEKAYLNARYDKHFTVKRCDIEQLIEKIEKLNDVVKEVCEANIEKHMKKLTPEEVDLLNKLLENKNNKPEDEEDVED